MRGCFKTVIGAIAGLSMFAATTPQATAQMLTVERVANGLSRPLYLTHAPGDFDRVFIVEQPGRIRVLKDGVLSTFLDIQSVVRAPGDPGGGNEQGLLGLAFHPDYMNNGRFFVNYTTTSGSTLVREFKVSDNPDVADASSGVNIITVGQPFTNHNGGWIGFGPNDGYLYIALGDGGAGNDPQQNGQDPSTLLGSMLRIDINGDDFPSGFTNYAIPASNPGVGDPAMRDEIWAYGLRNHWRNSFDRMTGDLFMGDVGQNAREELNVQPGTSTGGENYGWRCMEGFNCTGLSGCTCNSATLSMPLLDYARASGRCSIVGGYVYRGCAIPELQGTYFYADYCSAEIWSLTADVDANTFTDFTVRTNELAPTTGSYTTISSFGEDAYGEIYITDLFGGSVYKIVPVDATPIIDCDINGIEDACEILDGSADANGNGIVDICEVEPCSGNFDGDGDVDLTDFGAFGAAFNSVLGDDNYNADADFDGDNDVDLTDFGTFGSNFNRADCP